jgi:hypothetical protein
MTTVTVKLPDQLAGRLSAAARKRSTTRSAVIREALEQHLDDQIGPRNSPSCLDLISDLVGSVSGPADLSSNRRYLRGYGR